ncbi:hypothetical protein [Microtetraspora niveoalba]|uniref:hypothetical protein n=1 Tax=Microtetraspora niveoalba TaxID=46175 RepID=UPI000B29643D|nr:hypothetical protein [Microtetraspora niveoalba]
MAIKSSSGRTIAALTVGVLAGSLFAAGGMAAASSDSGVINACVKNGSGDVRIVAETTTCRANERKLSWNENIPQGPADSIKASVEHGDFNFPGSGNKIVYCPSGKTATGGGFFLDEPAENGREIIASAPLVAKDKPTGWLAVARKAKGTVYVICV